MTGTEFKRWLKTFHLLSSSPLTMGIVNLTPDSFSDGGRFQSLSDVLRTVEQMIKDGVDILDLGAESTRPGSVRIDENTELSRLMPVLEAIKKNFDICISIDTYKPMVMKAALNRGADWINDVLALENEASIEVITTYDVPVCLMHIGGSLNAIGQNFEIRLEDIYHFFQKKMHDLTQKGLNINNLVLDPGIGFGKSTKDNLLILKNLDFFSSLQRPILIGASRKRFIGELMNQSIHDRLFSSLTVHLLSYMYGSRIIRTHDVKATQESLRMAELMMNT